MKYEQLLDLAKALEILERVNEEHTMIGTTKEELNKIALSLGDIVGTLGAVFADIFAQEGIA